MELGVFISQCLFCIQPPRHKYKYVYDIIKSLNLKRYKLENRLPTAAIFKWIWYMNFHGSITWTRAIWIKHVLKQLVICTICLHYLFFIFFISLFIFHFCCWSNNKKTLTLMSLFFTCYMYVTNEVVGCYVTGSFQEQRDSLPFKKWHQIACEKTLMMFFLLHSHMQNAWLCCPERKRGMKTQSYSAECRI